MFFLRIPRWPSSRPRFFADLLSYLGWKATIIQEQRIERKFGIQTSAAEAHYLDDVASPNREFAVPYEAIQLDVFVDITSALRGIIGSNYQHQFIDLGSGKGRALVYAAEAGFKHCTGVEFSQSLHETAHSNIASYKIKSRSTCRFTLHCMDAADFDFPRVPIVLFMYNPFRSEVMRKVISNINAVLQDTENDFVVVYRNPTCSDDFRDSSLTLLENRRSFQILRAIR